MFKMRSLLSLLIFCLIPLSGAYSQTPSETAAKDKDFLKFLKQDGKGTDSHGVNGTDGHGGDVFEVNGALKTWDQIEWEKAFFIPELPIYPELIIALEPFSKIAPLTHRRLIEVLTTDGPKWYFVEPELKDVQDEGHSSMALSYKKIQAAVQIRDLVQINESTWNDLDTKGKIFLLVHEAIMNIGLKNFKSEFDFDSHRGQFVREITGILLNKHLSKFSKAKTLSQIEKYFRYAQNPDYKSFTSSLILDSGFEVFTKVGSVRKFDEPKECMLTASDRDNSIYNIVSLNSSIDFVVHASWVFKETHDNVCVFKKNLSTLLDILVDIKSCSNNSKTIILEDMNNLECTANNRAEMNRNM
jgi:hypothetical protein